MRLSQVCICSIIFFSLPVSQGEEKAGTSLLRSFGSLITPKAKERPQAVARPQNSLSSPSNGVTPTGSRLKPFGNPAYWGPTETNPEEDIAILPPLPDLRTPDQISKAERKRAYRNQKFALRHAQNQAREQGRKAAALAEVTRPPQDPSTALIQVESKRSGASDYGRRERPSAADGSSLKPFNASSSYIEGNELKYQWGNAQFVEENREDDGAELGILPPLPDLRTPEQVTKLDKLRIRRNSKYRSRQARLEADRKAREVAARPTLEPGF